MIWPTAQCKKSLTAQEIVTASGNSRGQPAGYNWFLMYRSGGPPISQDGGDGTNQPNSDYGVCDWPLNHSPGPWDTGCWAWTGSDPVPNPVGWDTLLYHVRPGLNSGNDTVVTVWVAKPGETAYTKIWDQNDVDLPFETVEGHNALIASGYMNGLNLATDIYHRYDQMIFSKEFIPCPQV